ncbi:hypothetical protein GLOIN_2v1843805 [Rhizophagus clarus]|uniref:Uncharacterized protein n=1 Tax=Rhizophagus clarus TaxID=94130 RepID=A0A8H3QTJ4_9GLOM|nr:hypothetical protein GLOIN_2v1843805 [Rhizophagus clarus]
MNASESYPGQNALISYLKERGSRSSYQNFLSINHDIITTPMLPTDTWEDLDATWLRHFLKEAESLLDYETFKEKIYSEHLRYAKELQIFWKRIIKKHKKENAKPATATTDTSCLKNKQKEKKRARDNDDDFTGSSIEYWNKQYQILEQKKDNIVYVRAFDAAFLVSSAHENLIAGDIIPFIKVLKKRLLARSQMSLASADEPVLQAIIENILPLDCFIPELSLVVDGKKSKGSDRFGYSDIFILGDTNVSLELKYVLLIGLIKNKVGANELEDLDKIIEKEDEKSLLKRLYSYWSKENKKVNKTTIGDILDDGINQLILYMKTISKGKVSNYSSSGVFDKRVKMIKNPNKLKGFVILVIGFRRILWRSVDEVKSNYIYDKA